MKVVKEKVCSRCGIILSNWTIEYLEGGCGKVYKPGDPEYVCIDCMMK